jgi:hypothetical protein
MTTEASKVQWWSGPSPRPGSLTEQADRLTNACAALRTLGGDHAADAMALDDAQRRGDALAVELGARSAVARLVSAIGFASHPLPDRARLKELAKARDALALFWAVRELPPRVAGATTESQRQ